MGECVIHVRTCHIHASLKGFNDAYESVEIADLVTAKVRTVFGHSPAKEKKLIISHRVFI